MFASVTEYLFPFIQVRGKFLLPGHGYGIHENGENGWCQTDDGTDCKRLSLTMPVNDYHDRQREISIGDQPNGQSDQRIRKSKQRCQGKRQKRKQSQQSQDAELESTDRGFVVFQFGLPMLPQESRLRVRSRLCQVKHLFRADLDGGSDFKVFANSFTPFNKT